MIKDMKYKGDIEMEKKPSSILKRHTVSIHTECVSEWVNGTRIR